jgi:hypothetical protein
LETNAAKRELLREDVLLLWERGVVPVAIADALNISDERVARYLKEAGVSVPSYLRTEMPAREARRCPHRGR